MQLQKVSNYLSTEKPDVHITAAGGVVYRISPQSPQADLSDVEVLLIHRNGFWDLPKGKRDAGEAIPACAAREVAEEVDCEMPMLLDMLARTEHVYKQGGMCIAKTTWWYAMVIKPGRLSPQKNEGIDEVKWMKLSKAKEKVGFDNLVQALIAFEVWYTEKIYNS